MKREHLMIGMRVVQDGRKNLDGRQWIGRVLAQNDPSAWSGTLFSPNGPPEQKALDKHIAWCREREGLDFDRKTPVAWEFGRIYFESVSSLWRIDCGCGWGEMCEALDGEYCDCITKDNVECKGRAR